MCPLRGIAQKCIGWTFGFLRWKRICRSHPRVQKLPARFLWPVELIAHCLGESFHRPTIWDSCWTLRRIWQRSRAATPVSQAHSSYRIYPRYRVSLRPCFERSPIGCVWRASFGLSQSTQLRCGQMFPYLDIRDLLWRVLSVHTTIWLRGKNYGRMYPAHTQVIGGWDWLAREVDQEIDTK